MSITPHGYEYISCEVIFLNRLHRKICADSFRFSLGLTASLLALAFLFSPLLGRSASSDDVAVSAEGQKQPTVILDAGHGGMDSGAVSVFGDEEKHLNLAVAKKLGAFLENAGVHVIYTRSEDVMLEYENSGGSRKTRDLMQRVEIAKNNPEAVFISIHMNTLPIEKYKGLQVFYTELNDANRALAQVTQNTVRSYLQKDNNRIAKDAEGKIYILDRIHQPAILVECGFLSNHEEATLLKDEEYQAKLACVLAHPILDFLRTE